MSRGALIWPMLVDIERIDTVATRTLPTPPGPGPGYDDDFQEPILISPTAVVPGVPNVGSPRGTISTQYQTAVRLHAQVEIVDFNLLRQFANGDAARCEVRLVFHYAEIETLGLLDATGAPTLRKHDRLRRILHARTEESVVEFADVPGLYAIRVEDRSFGLSSGMRNLLIITYQDREQGVES